jgi:hypothetical protein
LCAPAAFLNAFLSCPFCPPPLLFHSLLFSLSRVMKYSFPHLQFVKHKDARRRRIFQCRLSLSLSHSLSLSLSIYISLSLSLSLFLSLYLSLSLAHSVSQRHHFGILTMISEILPPPTAVNRCVHHRVSSELASSSSIFVLFFLTKALSRKKPDISSPSDNRQ